MKLSLMIIILLMTGTLYAEETKPKPPYDSGDGVYSTGRSFGYVVDTRTQLCFAYTNHSDTYEHSAYASGGLVHIDCRALAKRPEWQQVLTWVKKITH